MKLKLMASWAALSAFLNVKHEESKESTEVELSQEKFAELNAKLARVNELETELAALKKPAGETKPAEPSAELKTAQEKINQLTAEVEKLSKKPDQDPGKAAGEKTELKKGKHDLGEGTLSDLMNFSFETHNLPEEEDNA